MKKDVNKQLPNGDKTVKTEQKTRKKVDKIFVISVSIPVILALLIVLFITIPDPLRAAIQLKRAESFIEKQSISAVVITAPSETSGLLNGKEAILRDQDAESFSRSLGYVLENVKYSDTDTVNIGIWKIKIVMYNTTDKYELYIDDEGVYIENKGRLICYDFGDRETQPRERLLSDIQKYLNK